LFPVETAFWSIRSAPASPVWPLKRMIITWLASWGFACTGGARL